MLGFLKTIREFHMLKKIILSCILMLIFMPLAQAQKTETLVKASSTVVTAKQFAASKKIPEIRKSTRNANRKTEKQCRPSKKKGKRDIVAGKDWTLYVSGERDFKFAVSVADDGKNTPTAIQTETIDFPDGSIAHYTCYCEDAEPGRDTCKFVTTSGGEPDLNNCTGGDCCSIVVHVIDANGTPIAKFPG
jgi:hypothetical protein